jgi:hypothetical protein
MLPAGDGRAGAPPDTPNGLLPGERAGGRAPPGRGPWPGRGAPGAGVAPGAGAGDAGPGRGPGEGAPPLGGGACSRRVVSRWRASLAAFMAASWSAFSAAARCSAAATSMSCALVGLTTGAGRGGPGRGPGPPPEPPPGPPPAGGCGRFGGAKGLAAGTAGFGRGAEGTGAAEGADDAGAGEAEGAGADPPDSKLARSRRATGASTVLDADFTYSPSSCSFASTVLLSTPSSFASSCTRALPATELLTSRPGGIGPRRPHSCT